MLPDQVLTQAVHGFGRLLERAAAGGRLRTETPAAIPEPLHRPMRLDLDDQDAVPRDDDNEVRLASHLACVLGDGERVQDDPALGLEMPGQSLEERVFARRRVLRAVRGHHSCHCAP